MNRLVVAGHFEYWTEKSLTIVRTRKDPNEADITLPYIDDQSGSDCTINLDQLQIIFYFVEGALVVSFILLVFEIIHFTLKNCKIIIHRNIKF